MGKLKALDNNLNLAEKRIILRVDLNVPMLEGKVTDKSRINKVIPIIKEFTKKKAKVILISHLGRPKGKIDEKLSLKPIASVLENLLKSKVDVEIVSEHTKEFDSVIVSSGFYNFIVNETDIYKSRFSFVFVKTNRGWKILSHHSSELPIEK